MNSIVNNTYSFPIPHKCEREENCLKITVEELTAKNESNEYLIKGKLEEKESIIRQMEERYDKDIDLLKDAIQDMQQLLKDPTKLAELSKVPRLKISKAKNLRTKHELLAIIVQIERDKGLQETYLGFPFLAGNVDREFYVRGPLILFPINLQLKAEGKQPGWYIVFPEDEKPILNRALMEAIRKKGGPSLSDSFSDELEDLFNTIEDSKEVASKWDDNIHNQV